EATASIFANSLALLAEAFHVLIDVVALGIAFVALWLGSRPVTDRRTFGLLRLEILATVLNTVLLLVVAAVVLVEGLRRFSEPSQVQSGLVLAVAAVGLVSNGVSIYLLREPPASLAGRAGYLDVLADVAAHVVVRSGADPSVVLDELETCLRGDFDIEHSTFQLETEDRRRLESGTHP